MFSSSGYFRGVNCPYFGNGLCERSYCHFRHVKQDEKSKQQSTVGHPPGTAQKEETVSKLPTKSEDATSSGGHGSLLNLMGNAIKKVQRDIEKDKVQLYNLKHGHKDNSPAVNPVPLYTPTPINTKSDAIVIPPKKSPPKKNYLPAGIPAYMPTPISELRKKNNVKSQNEYDPLANFTTCTAKPVQTPIERITLGDAEKNIGGVKRRSSSDGYVPGKRSRVEHKKSSEEEMEAKFSEEDDDLDKSSIDDEQCDKKREYSLVKGSDGKQTLDMKVDEKGSEECCNLVSNTCEKPNPKLEENASDVQDKVRVADISPDSTMTKSEDKSDSDCKSPSLCDKSDEIVQEKQPANGQQSNGNQKESDSNQAENDRESQQQDSGHQSDKVQKDSKSSHQSRNDRKSKDTDSKQPSKDEEGDHRHRSSHKKRSSGSSRNKHKNHSSSPHRRKSSSSRHSPSRSKRHKDSSRKHKKNKHRSRSSSRSHRHNDKKSSERDRHSHRSRSEKREKSRRDSSKSKKSDRHRHRSKKHSSKSSPRRRHRHSSYSSDSSPSTSDHSSRSSSSLSLSITPSSSRASSVCKEEQATGKTSHSSKAVSSSMKSSPRSGAIKHEISRYSKHERKSKTDGSFVSSIQREKSIKSPSLKSPSRILSPSGPTLFEKFQRTVSHVDLFGEDSDSDNKAASGSKYSNGNIKVKQEANDLDVIVLSDGDVSDAEYKSDDHLAVKKQNKTYSSRTKDHSDIKVDRGPHSAQVFDDLTKSAELPKRKLVAEEFVHERETKTMKKLDPNPAEEGQSVIGPKKRTAHIANPDAIKRTTPSKLPARLTPSQVMLNRFKQVQSSQPEVEVSSPTTSENHSESSGAKHRIAHQPKPGHTLLKKKAGKSTSTSAEGHTPSLTVGRDGKRVAHIPAKAILKRPIITSEIGAKLPSNIRQRYLDKLVDECLSLYTEERDAYERAVVEEKAVYERASNKNIYLNVAINAIKKLRDENSKPETNGENLVKSPTKNPKALSHAMILGGAKALNTGYTVNRSGGPVKLPDRFSGPDFYKLMARYVLTMEQLAENGFPAPSDKEGEAVLQIPERFKNMSKDVNEKQCCRCGKKFVVYPEGQYARQESCTYHWGKCFKRRVAGSIDNRYTCCSGDLETPGCQISKYHVHDQNRYQNLKKYKMTLPSSPSEDGDYGVFALDCEMVYTSAGSELARVTVIDQDLKSVYESLVRPEHPILDYNTRFSGLTEDNMDGITTTLLDVQNALTDMFNDQTILIGHSLESDFIALKLIHKTVVDTSVVFPHRLGPPLKRALKTLMAEKLQKIIQNDVGGHDSREDAVSCMELMLWKVKQDAKKISRS